MTGIGWMILPAEITQELSFEIWESMPQVRNRTQAGTSQEMRI